MPRGAKDPSFKEQSEVLNKVIAALRKDVLEQIERKKQPHKKHPDSTTGLTSTVDLDAMRVLAENLEGIQLSSVSEEE